MPDATRTSGAKFLPPSKEKFKLYNPTNVSNFQIIRLNLTPKCFYTYY